MSKYDALWEWIRENGTDSFKLTFAEIGQTVFFRSRFDGFRKIVG